MNTFVRYGLIAGALLAVAMFGPWFVFGARPEWMKVGELVGYTAMLLCLSATWFAMRRERDLAGGIRYGRAFGIGVGVSAVAAVLFGISTWAFYAIVGDALPQALYDFYAQGIRDSGAPAERIAAQLAELESMRGFFFNRPLQAAVMAATVFVIGVIESVLGAWLVSRQPGAPRTLASA